MSEIKINVINETGILEMFKNNGVNADRYVFVIEQASSLFARYLRAVNFLGRAKTFWIGYNEDSLYLCKIAFTSGKKITDIEKIDYSDMQVVKSKKVLFLPQYVLIVKINDEKRRFLFTTRIGLTKGISKKKFPNLISNVQYLFTIMR